MGLRQRGLLLYAALAIVIPLPALALAGGGSSAGGLSVSASLDHCGVSTDSVVCQINANWTFVEGADRYTASVTAPDGSVTDYGDVGGGSATLWVPYAGNGGYTVTVSAWDDGDGDEKSEVVAEATSDSSSDEPAADGQELMSPGNSEPDTSTVEEPAPSDPATEPEVPAEEPTDPVVTTPEAPPEPTCEEPLPAPAPDPDPSADSAVDGSAATEASTDAAAPATTTDGCPAAPASP